MELKKKPICVFDMDGVISRTHYALEKELKKNYPQFSLNNVFTYNFNQDLSEIEKQLLGVPCDIIFKEFRKTTVFEEAEIAPFFLDFIEKNKDKYDFIIHSLAFSDEVAKTKKNWLKEKLGDRLNYFKDIIIVIGNNKPALDNVDYIFEDSLKQLKKYDDTYPNTKLVLYDMPFNRPQFNNSYKNILDKCKRIYNFNINLETI